MSEQLRTKKRAYLVCDYTDLIAPACGAWDIGVEHMGNCGGRLLGEDGELLGCHHSSSFGWLRSDLKGHVNADEYEFIDLIGQEVPERFKLKESV